MIGPALLDRIDQAIAVLVELRAEVVASLPASEGNGLDETDDLAPDSLLDTCAASARFGTIRKWCRTEGLGIHTGGGGWSRSRGCSGVAETDCPYCAHHLWMARGDR